MGNTQEISLKKEFDSKFPKGTLTRKEFIEDNIKINGGNKAFWNSIFTKFDSEEKGYISFSQFKEFLHLSSGSMDRESLELVFNILDFENTGILSKKDICNLGRVINRHHKKEKIHKHFDEVLTREQLHEEENTFCENLFEVMNKDGKDHISKEEFINTCEEHLEMKHILATTLDQVKVLRDVDPHSSKTEKSTESHQVGGHRDIIYLENVIYKPYLKQEFEFYEEMNQGKTEVDKDLQKVTCKYFGKKCLELNVSPNKRKKQLVHYIILENLTKGIQKPCVLDCKMSTEGYAKNHSKLIHKKIYQSYVSKISTSKEWGFRISGMKVHKKDTNSVYSMSKGKGKRLKSNQIKDTFLNFFNNGKRLRVNLLKNVVPKLEQFKRIFETQTKYAFFSSSLIFIYDGENEENDEVIVKLVDFAHTFKVNKKDEGLLKGITSMINLFNEIINEN